jgi:hypothetical protein
VETEEAAPTPSQPADSRSDPVPEPNPDSARVSKGSAIAGIFRSRDFLRDIIVTTLGVLIALAIGAGVDELRWQFRIDATERVMREEMGLVGAVYIERRMLQPCIARRLSELGEILSEARSTGRLPKVENTSYPPNHARFGDSWALMMGNETPLHIDPQKLINTATFWVNNSAYSSMVDRERDAFDRLSLIENRPGPVSDNILTELDRQLIEAMIASDSSLWIARQDSRVLAENGVAPLYRPNETLDKARMADQLRRRFICQPLRVDGRPYRLKGPVRQPRQPTPPQG